MINSQCVHMFYSKRQPEGRMMKYNKLYLLMIVALLQISAYTAQLIPVQNPINQQADVILIDDRGSSETSFLDGPDVGTGSNFGLTTIPFLALALLMIPMVMMTMMSTTETPMPVVPTSVLVTVPTPQAVVPTTQCVPTNCPANYRLLNDQTASSNCYFDSGTQADQIWSNARKACTATPGAHLWRPNSRSEADAVKNTFGISDDEYIWTSAHSPSQDENFVFTDNNDAFLLYNVPFGRLDDDDIGESCIQIEFDTDNNPPGVWEWENDTCDDEERFVCEFPRKVCP